MNAEARVDAAVALALGRLEAELAPALQYHNLWHTAQEVLPMAQRLGAAAGLPPAEAQLLQVAAAFHDLGFVVQTHEHERVGAALAAEALPGLGFTPPEVGVVQGMIMATRLPQSPATHLEALLADADLDVLGRADFLTRNRCLRAELAVLGKVFAEAEWWAGQLAFVRGHAYFTPQARALRDHGQRRNVLRLQRQLARASG